MTTFLPICSSQITKSYFLKLFTLLKAFNLTWIAKTNLQYAHIFIVFTQNVKTKGKKEGKEMRKEKGKELGNFMEQNRQNVKSFKSR